MTSDPMDKLEPCPFCQSADVSLSYSTNLSGDIDGRFVECENCGASGPICDSTTVEAITAWNTRAALKQGEQ